MNMLSFHYDAAYDPPAPVIEMGISHHSANSPQQTVTALVDSGADVTMIPLDLLKQSGASYVEQRSLRGVTGATIQVHRYVAAIHLGNEILRGIRVVGHGTLTDAIVGRDVLNRLRMTLDGPAEVTEIQQR